MPTQTSLCHKRRISIRIHWALYGGQGQELLAVRLRRGPGTNLAEPGAQAVLSARGPLGLTPLRELQ